KHGRDEFMVQLWDLATRKERSRFPTNGYRILSVAFSPDGRRAAAGDAKGTARIWDLASGKQILNFQEPNERPIAVVNFSPDGRLLVIGAGEAQEEFTKRLYGDDVD